ncbi:glycosyltransferase family 4 protein [Candidatus Saccharibacteria bacterium]|nr:glycosyltransferase family 4 protein [Candidatus Saccharibacteria bacterium]
MKIGIVLDESFDGTDGIQQYMHTVGRWLTEHGHTVYYLVGSTRRTDIDGVYSLSRNMRVKFNGNWLSMPLPTSSRKLRTLLRTLELDILHIQTPYSPFLAGKLIRFAADATAVVGTFHILPFGRMARLGSDILGKINTKTAQRFDAMMAVSPPAQVFAGKHYGFSSVVVPNPFVHDIFSVARRGKLVAHSRKRIVFLGRLVPRKGARSLLKAVSEMNRYATKKLPMEVIIAGKGSQLPRLQRYVRDHELTDIVSFPGYVSEQEKPRLLASADILVFPSSAGESFGISLLEGMAASRGVVLAGNNPGYASVVADERQLIDPKDVSDFARKLVYWLENDSERLNMARIQHIQAQLYDIDKIGPRIERVYKQALNKRRNIFSRV